MQGLLDYPLKSAFSRSNPPEFRPVAARTTTAPREAGVLIFVFLPGGNPVKYTDPDGRVDTKAYGFKVDQYVSYGSQNPQQDEYKIYYSADLERLTEHRNRVRGGLNWDGLTRYGTVDGKDRWTGRRRGDSYDTNRVVDVGEISEIEITNVSDEEEAVLNGGIIEQRYFVSKDADGKYNERFASERSLGADGDFTDEIYEIPE
jgi:hypothetical protein